MRQTHSPVSYPVRFPTAAQIPQIKWLARELMGWWEMMNEEYDQMPDDRTSFIILPTVGVMAAPVDATRWQIWNPFADPVACADVLNVMLDRGYTYEVNRCADGEGVLFDIWMNHPTLGNWSAMGTTLCEALTETVLATLEGQSTNASLRPAEHRSAA